MSRGLGRAILHLQRHDAAPYRDAILRCCLKNTGSGMYVEGFRAVYLFEVIELAKDADFYRRAILDALEIIPASAAHDAEHLMALAMQFVLHKQDTQALELMYKTYRRCLEDGHEVGVHSLMDADGINAFLFLLDPFKTGKFSPKKDPSHSAYLLYWLEDEFGQEQTREKLYRAAYLNPVLHNLLDTVYAWRQQRIENKKAERAAIAKFSYAEVKASLDNTRFHFTEWVRDASDDDIKQAAHDFMLDENPQHLRNYLSMFRVRQFPLDDYTKLFKLAGLDDAQKSNSKMLSRHAISVLENIHHPAVRQFALDSIAKGIDSVAMVGILQSNFEAGDWKLIDTLAHKFLTGSEDMHLLGMSVRDIFEHHPSTDAVPILLHLYEHVPCSHCREDFVRYLVSLDAMPKWMAEECLYDSNFDLREYARRGFRDADEPSN